MFTLSNYLDGDCTTKEWIEQHNPIILEVGKIYVSQKETWSETHYKIIYSDNYIATAVKVWDAIHKKHEQTKEYDLFYAANGFKYNDITRPFYRLSQEVL